MSLILVPITCNKLQTIGLVNVCNVILDIHSLSMPLCSRFMVFPCYLYPSPSKFKKHIYISLSKLCVIQVTTKKTTYSFRGLSASYGSQSFLSSFVMQCGALHHVTQLDMRQDVDHQWPNLLHCPCHSEHQHELVYS